MCFEINKTCLIFYILLCCFFLSPSIFADRGLKVISIKNSKGEQVGLYKKSHALVIGVSDYKAGWPDLESIPGEIEQVEESLMKLGFKVEKVINPDSKELKLAFEDFINSYGYDEHNRLLLFYSGHGHSRKGGKKGYLVPVDAPNPRKDEKGFLRKALTMSDILNMSKKMEAKHALFLFDSCFSGTIFKAKALPKQPPHISSFTASPVRQFITAGSAGEEVPANSVFTPSFVRGLRGEADINKDNYVTGTELGMYLHEKVLYYNTGQTPQYGKIKDPDLDEGDFVFALGRDIYEEPQVQLPSSPTGTGKLDFGDIEADSKNAKKLAEIKEQWSEWQKNLETAYEEALKFDKRFLLTARKKAEVWQRIVNGFSQDNPYSLMDQMLRKNAKERMDYWKNRRNKPKKEDSVGVGEHVVGGDRRIEGHYEYVRKRKWVDTSKRERVWVEERVEGDRRIAGHYEDRNVPSGYWQEYEEKVWIPAHYE